MEVAFNLNEVFEIAKKVEVNGAAFYKKAAEICADHREFLLHMAQQEEGHEDLFEKMRLRFAQEETQFVHDWESDSIALTYLHGLADSIVFKLTDKVENAFQGGESYDEILDLAIKREGDSILFFLGVKEFLIKDEDKKVIEDLIREEMSHISWIKKQRLRSK